MSRLTIITKDKAQVTMESLYQDLERRIVASPPGLRDFLMMCLMVTQQRKLLMLSGLQQRESIIPLTVQSDMRQLSLY